MSSRPSLFRAAAWIIAKAGPLRPVLRGGARAAYGLLHTLTGGTIPNPLSFDDLVVYHHNDAIFAPMLATGGFEAETTRLLRDVLEPGMTVLDVGANIGVMSLIAARAVGETGSVHAFEPGPTIVPTLQRNVEANGFAGRIFVHALAVGAKPGTVQIHVAPTGDALASIYAEAAESGGGTSVATAVPLTSLDAWGEEHRWPLVDLIKIDVEGAEISVLEGMRELCNRSGASKLIVEFNIRTLRIAEKTPQDLFAALDACGFRWIKIVDYGLESFDPRTDLPRLLRRIAGANVEGVNFYCERSTP